MYKLIEDEWRKRLGKVFTIVVVEAHQDLSSRCRIVMVGGERHEQSTHQSCDSDQWGQP